MVMGSAQFRGTHHSEFLHIVACGQVPMDKVDIGHSCSGGPQDAVPQLFLRQAQYIVQEYFSLGYTAHVKQCEHGHHVRINADLFELKCVGFAPHGLYETNTARRLTADAVTPPQACASPQDSSQTGAGPR